MLWMRAMSEKGLHSVACACANTPMEEWEEKDVKECETIARRSGFCEGGEYGSYVMVARIGTLQGRDLRAHDVEEEVGMRTKITGMHGYMKNGILDADQWNSDAVQEIRKLIQQAYGAEFSM